MCYEIFRDDDDSKSEVSLSSQNSYDPRFPSFQNRDGEIASVGSTHSRDDETSDVVLQRHRPRPDTGKTGLSLAMLVVVVVVLSLIHI